MLDYKKMGERLRAIRKKKKITLLSMANEYGISQGYLSNIELGQKKIPLEVLLLYSMKLGIKLIDILKIILK